MRRKPWHPISDAKFALMTEILKDERTTEWVAKTHKTSIHNVYKLRRSLGVAKKQTAPHTKRNIK